MAHKHSVYDTDLHFVIDPITRKITTECKKTQLMQKDHNSERFTFEIPRYIEGHDMSLCNVVQIHYINTNSTNKDYQVQDIYEVNDLQLSPDSEDIVIGSWLISSNATTYSGTLNFVIRFACVDEETKAIDYQWFTDIYSAITVAKTIYNVDVVTDGESSDILEKWKEEISKAVYESTLELVQEAKKSAGDAAKSETNAGEFAKNAASSAESSKKSAETATSQASLASESRIAAESSAETATSQASLASESRIAAESSASSASKSAVESGKSAEEASVSAANAKESEENAKKSEQAASNSASAAAQSETKAKASVADAASSAQSASDDARTAIESSNSAQQSAGTASEKAAEASESAQSASTSASSAGDSATAASGSAILAESYTHGRTGTREGEDTDNAKYYMEQAKAVSIVDVATTEKAGIVKPDGTTITADSDGTIHGANTYELPVATTDTLGGVKPDGTTITADGDGIIRVNADSELSETSTNPVQNRVVKSALDSKSDNNHTHNYAGSSLPGGEANSAAKLSTARNIALTGAISGNANFDGSGNVSIATTANADSELSATSTNPVQNKVVKSNIDTLQSEIDSTKKDIAFKSIDTATSGTSFTDAEDGNMLVTDWTKNLLNPTLETTTRNGVTCTNNGDGTYTLNGTATANTFFLLLTTLNVKKTVKKGIKYKICGIGAEGNSSLYLDIWMKFEDGIESIYFIKDKNGANFSRNKEIIDANIALQINSGVTVNNVLIKPMLTTDLSATYDDFVPYSGYEIKSCGKNLMSVNDATNGATLDAQTRFNIRIRGLDKGNIASDRIYLLENEVMKGHQSFTFEVTIDEPYGIAIKHNGSTNDIDIEYINYMVRKGTYTISFDVTSDNPSVLDGLILHNLQLEHGDLETDFEPYTGETIIITNDTELPAFGLKSHKGITNIISPGNVKAVYPSNKSGAGLADAVAKNDSSIDTLQGEIDNLKKSVSDGKTTVANAITAKGVTTATDATFATMAGNISKITTGVDTSDATATADQILTGQTAYVKGSKITGTLGTRVNDFTKKTLTNLSTSRTLLAGASVGNYALFAGGRTSTSSPNERTPNIDVYNTLLARSTNVSLDVAASDMAGASNINYALFAGGYDGNSISKVYAFDSSLVITIPLELRSPRYTLAGVSFGDYALFAGGIDDSLGGPPKWSSTVDAYDSLLTRNTPTDLSLGRYGLVGASVGNYALFAGGQGGGITNIVDAYNTSLVRSTPTELSLVRSRLAGASVGDYALFAGGINSYAYSIVESYNSSLVRATENSLMYPASDLEGVSVGNYALFAGGYDGNSTPNNSIVAYNASLARSSPCVLSESKYGLKGASIGKYAIFAGGNRGSGASSYSGTVDAIIPPHISISDTIWL